MRKSGFFQIIAASVCLLLPAGAREPIRSLDDLRVLEAKAERLVEQVMPATVALVVKNTGASGSGVITSKEGLILTAAHVTDGAEEVDVVFASGEKTKAKVLGSNFSKDIGMAQITEAGPWPFVTLGESKPLKAGDWVAAMGHSEGYDASRTPPLRFGRVVSDGPGKYLTTDCKLIGGDSGGPLFDLDGKLVGINSSIGQSLENNNHAGIDGFREDWDRLLAGESWGELQLNPFVNPERPVIGILTRDRSDGGVLVERVTAGSPAAKAGMRPGDVIRSVDGSRVQGGHGLRVLLTKNDAGDKVVIGMERGGRLSEVEMQLARQDQLFEQR